MKASDYIVEYLISRGISDVFGYPGGMVTHLIDSLSKYKDKITAHITYHEQGAAFAACGYAQVSGKVGVAYATSGPGATNLITGICNAYYDSIPTLFITGQVNTFESKGNLGMRQRGFQESDIVSMVSNVTKYAAQIKDVEELEWQLNHAFSCALEGRKGPVLLDIPMDVFRAEFNGKISSLRENNEERKNEEESIKKIVNVLSSAQRPVLLLGNGIKMADEIENMRKLVKELEIPVVSTMLAVDVVPEKILNYGFVGAYGSRTANFIVSKCDLLITFGARLDVRQVGAVRQNFAPNAQIVRIDIDEEELRYKIRENEIQICADLKDIIRPLICKVQTELSGFYDCSEWISICNVINSKLEDMDNREPNKFINKISSFLPEEAVITTDVGQNQVWVAQSMRIKEKQKIFFSGGHGAMGYSLPAAIGCAIATGKKVYSFNGDGGIQMNIQELQTVVREKLPLKIILFNNSSLGMIRHFQEMYFQNNYYQTVPDGGYTVPDFEKIALAYGLEYRSIRSEEDIKEEFFIGPDACLIEVFIQGNTYVYPKLEFGNPNNDQEPLIDRELYAYLCGL